MGSFIFSNKKYIDLKDKYETNEIIVLEYENILKNKNKSIESLLNDIKHLSEVIDEYTTKSEDKKLESEIEVSEVNLKKRKK